jgi:hypothetical protein
LTPEDIVTAARDEASPAHRYFEWNDQKAAQQYRLEQARYILRVIHVEIAPQETIRAFHSVHIDEMSSTDRQYVSLKQVQSNDRFRQQIIEGALSELRLWQRRYRQYSELDHQVRLISEALAE